MTIAARHTGMHVPGPLQITCKDSNNIEDVKLETPEARDEYTHTTPLIHIKTLPSKSQNIKMLKKSFRITGPKITTIHLTMSSWNLKLPGQIFAFPLILTSNVDPST